jgi:putative heme-binding domain-containing protein
MKLVILYLLFVPLMVAQDHGSVSANPYPTPEDAEAGGKSFRSQCAACHGLDASGGALAPSLVAGTYKNGGSDEAMFRTITGGVAGTAMPAFNLPGRETWQIITFLRSLNILKAAEKATGNAAQGAQLFASHSCGACHAAGASNGVTGPDLNEIGLRRSLTELETAITNPDAEVAPEFWSIRARGRSGEAISGIRLNEDMDTVQIRDDKGRLRSFRKSELASLELVRTSPMPSFQTKLTSAELQDLVAYLASLRKPAGILEANQ